MRKIVTLVYALVVTSCLAQEPISDSTCLPNQSKNYGACIMRNDSIVGINENERFAMHSVMKFPQALYVADYLSRKGLNLDDTIVVEKADLMQDTWSPMLKRFEGKKAFSYAELLELSLGQSDNNACELLFKFCGKPQAVRSKSGRDTDKIEAAGLTPVEQEVISVPGIKELPLTLECRVLYRQEQESDQFNDEITRQFYTMETGDHICYYGEIVAAYIIED